MKKTEQIDDFRIIGISTVTTNENNKSLKDLGDLWSRFYGDNIAGKVASKTTDNIYSIYTDYESDYMGKYTAIIGFKVKELENIPNGLTGREFKGGKYIKFTAKGEMPDAVMKTWIDIWNDDKELNRIYTADFEVYGEKSQNGKDAEVEIYVATK